MIKRRRLDQDFISTAVFRLIAIEKMEEEELEKIRKKIFTSS